MEKPVPYAFDLGNLLCSDTNPFPSSPTTDDISSAARDCAQALVHEVLTTCPIHANAAQGTYFNLPTPTTALPREKPFPRAKALTKWEQFAQWKGIKPKTSQGKMRFDEESGEWLPKWGYKGHNKAEQQNWLVEVDEKKEAELQEGETVRAQGRRDRKKQVRRNLAKQRANEMQQSRWSRKS